MTPAASALIVAAQALGCPQGFAPPLDRPLTVVTIDEREPGGMRHVMTQRRTLTFTRDGAGYRATLVQRDVSADAAPEVAKALIAGSGAFTALPIAFRVSADGCTATPLDGTSARKALRQGVERMLATARDPRDRALMGRLLAPLLALDDARWDEMLAGMIRPLLPAGADVRPGHAMRSAVSPLGGVIPLTGERRVTAHGGATHIATRLASRPGDAAAALAERGRVMPATRAPDAGLAMTVRIDQAVDARSGLVVESRSETELGTGAGTTSAHRIVSTTRIGGIGPPIGR